MTTVHCPKRYLWPVILALAGISLTGAAMLMHPCGFSATTLGETLSTPLICGVLGLIFMGCGVLFSYLMYRRTCELDWLQAHGERMDARVVAINEVPSRNPHNRLNYQVVCEACDPLSGRLRRFFSEPLIKKPTCCRGTSRVGVLTDPSNPKLYHVEV